MRRRALLRAVGAAGVAGTTALAGCTSLVMTASTAEIADVGEVAERHGLSLDAEIVQSEYTEEHPARVRITLTNGDELQQISWCGFRGRDRKSSPHGLWLFPTSRVDDLRETDRWVAPEGWGESSALAAGTCTRQPFDPGESTSVEFLLVDDDDATGYLAPGTYRWEKSYEVVTGGPVLTGSREAEPRQFDWGFSVELR